MPKPPSSLLTHIGKSFEVALLQHWSTRAPQSYAGMLVEKVLEAVMADEHLLYSYQRSGAPCPLIVALTREIHAMHHYARAAKTDGPARLKEERHFQQQMLMEGMPKLQARGGHPFDLLVAAEQVHRQVLAQEPLLADLRLIPGTHASAILSYVLNYCQASFRGNLDPLKRLVEPSDHCDGLRVVAAIYAFMRSVRIHEELSAVRGELERRQGTAYAEPTKPLGAYFHPVLNQLAELTRQSLAGR